MRVRRVVPLLALLAALILAGDARAQQAHIYSNVEYNEEGGDLLGVEVQISTDGGHVKGELKIYEGGCAVPTAVSGSSSAGRIEISGKNGMYGRIELIGTVREDTINGVLRLEKGGRPEKVRLKLISKPHC